ncbi:MAG: GGDEF domain-containing protein [Pseudomonadota bacterium]
MSLLNKWIGRSEAATTKRDSSIQQTLLDNSLDTLDLFLRTTGECAIEVEDQDPRFHDLCKEYARHVTNGAPIPDEGIEKSADGARQWAKVRSFFTQRRKLESEYVDTRLSNYRVLVEDMVVGLQSISTQEDTTRSQVMRGLERVEHAATHGSMEEIRQSVRETLQAVATVFEDQQNFFQTQINQANQRMMSLRVDLAAARNDMKRDPLTDTLSRGAFDLALQQTVALNFVLRQPVCVAIIDLDGFARINESSGHAAGDDVLRSISDCLARTFVRRSDVVARFGGGQFALILSDITLETAQKLLQRVLESIRSTVSVPYSSKDQRVTCSAGVTELLPSDTVDALITRTTQALRQAKSDGRDRLVAQR